MKIPRFLAELRSQFRNPSENRLVGQFDSTYRHHLSHLPVTELISEIPKHRQLQGVRIKTVVGILRIGAASEETLTCFTVKELLPAGSFSVLHNLTFMAEHALAHRLILK